MEAVNVIIQCMPGAFVSVAPTPEIAHPSIIEDRMMKNPLRRIGRSDLLKSVYRKMRGKDFEDAVNTLIATGRIKRSVGISGAEFYELNKDEEKQDKK